MKALILAGGKGTRLRPLTTNTPKPVVPVVNRPFLEYQIESLRAAGIGDVTLSLNYQPDKIEDILGDGRHLGALLSYTTEPRPMGTAGAYKYAAKEARETIIVFNGDILTNIDLKQVIAQHKERRAEATIVLTPVENPAAYGLVETDGGGEVLRFLEKPGADELDKLATNNINAGIYVLEPSVLEKVPEGQNFSFEYQLFPDLLANNSRFFAFIAAESYWLDIGTPAAYLQANLDCLSGRVGAPPNRAERGQQTTNAGGETRSAIAADCRVAPNARIANSVLGPGVVVEADAEITDSVIWPDARIGAATKISRAIIGRGCRIGNECVVSAGTVFGDHTVLPDFSNL
jgi:NDP-sugar pyrophosphorylase family protein